MPQIDSSEVTPAVDLNGTQETNGTKQNAELKVGAVNEPVDSESTLTDQVGEVNVATEIKYLYEGEKKCPCCINWTSTKPEIEKAETGSVITVRQSRDHNDEKPLAIHSILIHSSQLKDTLRQVLRGYADVLEGDTDYVMEKPFEPAFHCWSQMTALNEQIPTEGDGLAHFRMLYQVLSEELGDTFKEINVLLANQSITYKSLWAVFRNEDIITSVDCFGQPVALRVLQGTYVSGDEPGFLLSCNYIDTDGTGFGLVRATRKIPPFKGTRKIATIVSAPMRFLPSSTQKEIGEAFIKRGRRFAELVGHDYRYMDYEGLEYNYTEEKMKPPRKTTGRIVIDSTAFGDENWIHAPAVAPLFSDSDDVLGRSRCLQLVRDSDFLLCSATVRGYSMSSKSWASFLVEGAKEIQWNESCASKLILPGGYKELLLSMVEEQMRGDDGFDDFIAQKGQGLIVLLSGDTGVGKTLTAEVVAEEQRAPLYSVSAGQLGFDAGELEENMKLVLELAARWKAVLLLDEGDVFLEKRSTSDLKRNRLVSIFLQILEYYSGTLIVTTNRGAVIDEAVRSRVHINIKVPSLSREIRKTLWQSFIEQNKVNHILQGDDFDTLADTEMNGREIKNAVKSSILMAKRKKLPLSMDQLRVTLDILMGSKEP